MSHNTTHIISYHTHHLVFPKIHIILLLLPFPSDFSPLLSSVFPPFSVDWSRGQRLGLYLLLAFLGVLNFLVYVCGQMGLSSLSPPPSKKGGTLPAKLMEKVGIIGS
ncbi:hypothetical protein GmHk_08G024186 [Glycine max]|nr:hypothetical protein GmHk_08G024186 [Glycine max]